MVTSGTVYFGLAAVFATGNSIESFFGDAHLFQSSSSEL